MVSKLFKYILIWSRNKNKTMNFVKCRGFRVASGIGLDTPKKEEKPQPLKT